jgi:transcriptional regulator GlxA family with amidase domain
VRPRTRAGRDAEALELLTLLLEASAEDGPTVAGGGGEAGWIVRSTAALGADLGEPLDLRSVAASVGIPYETWRRRYRASTGTSPYAERSARRLAAATDLLVHTGLSVRDVAAATGFSDERHLIRRFRELTGLTPRAFRDIDRPG